MDEAVAVLGRVSKSYRMDAVEVPVLREVDLLVRPGVFTVLLGPSGSGKTTLLNLIGGIDRADQGEVVVAGQPYAQLSDDALTDFRARHIGFVFQSFNLIPRTSAYENVEMPLAYAGMKAKERRDRVNAALDVVGLGDRAHHMPSELSGGQQQRVAVARAIATHPALLLADEPTGNLDHVSGADVLASLEALNARGILLIVVTHDDEVAARARRHVRMRAQEPIARFWPHVGVVVAKAVCNVHE